MDFKDRIPNQSLKNIDGNGIGFAKSSKFENY
jgi:hypothetical protein